MKAFLIGIGIGVGIGILIAPSRGASTREMIQERIAGTSAAAGGEGDEATNKVRTQPESGAPPLSETANA